MRTLVIVGFVLGLVATPASAKPPPRPAVVLGKVTLGGPSGLAGIHAFADAIKPGTSAMLTTRSLISNAVAVSLDGLDLDGPVHVLWVTTPKSSGPVLLARVSDAALVAPGTTIRNGWAISGLKNHVVRVQAWAFATLDGVAPPPDLVATIYPAAILNRFRKEIAEVRKLSTTTPTGLPPEMMKSYWEMLMGLAADTEEIVVRVEASRDLGGVDVAFVPKPKSRLGKFAGLQQPSDFALLSKLPSSKPAFVGAGRLTMGPYRTGMLEMMATLYGPMSGGKLAPVMAELMKATTGEMAMAMTIDPKSGMAIDSVYSLDDAKAADASLAKMFALIAKPMTMKIAEITSTMEAVPGNVTHGDVAIRSYTTTYTGQTPNPMMPGGKMSSYAAIADKLLVFGANVAAPRAIDAARGKGTPFKSTAAQTALFDASRKRKDSMAFVMDLGALSAFGMPAQVPAGANMIMTLGFADGAAHFRMALPSSLIKTMAFGVGGP